VVEELRREQRQGGARELEARAQEHQTLSPGLVDALRALTPEQRLCMFLTYHMEVWRWWRTRAAASPRRMAQRR
jgi:hypothetical protein